jgi:spore germination cell wall hydrolase CwlJ-like protein
MFGRRNQKGRRMYFNRKVTNKVLIGVSVCLIAVNLLIPVAKAQANKVTVSNLGNHFSNEVQCLAENIYYESASESFEGKLAVAQVTLNRVNSGKFPKTVCGVVKQKDEVNGRMVCQFSWFCNQAYSMIRNPYQWEESVLVAKKALTSEVAHVTLHREKAMYYHANYVKPNWNLPKITQIGNHIFYKERSKI